MVFRRPLIVLPANKRNPAGVDAERKEEGKKMKAGLISREPIRRKPAYDIFCRLYNFLAALIGLIVFSPLFLGIALWIKLLDGSPVIYGGKRVGKNGRIFILYKFRTMKRETEKQIGARLVKEDEPVFTPVGRVLRKRKLDEFPQLINVLKGEMNLVGPRPVRPVFVEPLSKEIPGYGERFKIKPGITGFAQLRKGYYLSPRDKLRYELLYLRRRSLLLDAGIIFLTFTRLLSRIFTGFGLLFALFIFAYFMPQQRLFGLSVNFLGIEISVLFFYLLLGGIFFIVFHLRREMVFVKTPLDRVFLAFSTATLISVLINSNIVAGLRDWFYLIVTSFGLFYFMVNAIKTPSEEIKGLLNAYNLLAFIGGVTGLFGLYQHFRIPAADSPFKDPAMMITYGILLCPLLLWQIQSVKNWAGKVVLGAGILFLLGIMLVVFPPWGLFLLAMTLAVYFSVNRRKKMAVVILLAGLFFGFKSFAGKERLSPELQPVLTSALDGQLARWERALKRNQPHSFIGTSTGFVWREVEEELEPLNSKEGFSSIGKLERTGNMYLTILIKNGAIGLFVFLGVMMSILSFIRNGYLHCSLSDPGLTGYLRAVFSGVAGVMLSLFFTDALYFPSVQVFFWSVVGMAAVVIFRGGNRIEYYRIWQYHH